MDGGGSAKGTVTSLSSMFSPEEAQGAARRVEGAIAERRMELDSVLSFVEDNSSLVKLVQRLPHQLHHDIMVPFGKGAFFPGRLVHTNEFLVLLGEGYYADRTSKQTVEILNRRGKELESQVDSLNSMIKDLKAEALFFGDTATEAAEGLVEIREEYVEEHPTEEVSPEVTPQADSKVLSENVNVKKSSTEDEFARIMSRMEELEKEELAAEGESSDEESLNARNEMEKAEEDDLLTGHSSDTDDDDDDDTEGNDFDAFEGMKSDSSRIQPRKSMFNDLRISELNDSAVKPLARGKILLHKDLMIDGGTSSIPEKVIDAPRVSENLSRGRSLGEMTPAEPLQPAFDSQKAFTGSIVERPYNLQNQGGTPAQSTSSLPSKPVSRFRMQRK